MKWRVSTIVAYPMNTLLKIKKPEKRLLCLWDVRIMYINCLLTNINEYQSRRYMPKNNGLMESSLIIFLVSKSYSNRPIIQRYNQWAVGDSPLHEKKSDTLD